MAAAHSLLRFCPPCANRCLPHLTSIAFRGYTPFVTAAYPPAARIELAQIQVSVHGKELAIIQPKDVDQVLNMYIEQGRLDGDPYWCRVWPSAIVLAEEILKNPQLVAKLRVCDLGAGLGLAGLAAVVAGAREVVYYDQEPLALLCSLLTVHANMPHVTTNLSLVMQHICADVPLQNLETSTLPLWKSVSSLSLVVSQHSGRQDMEPEEGSIPRARAEVFNWYEEKAEAFKFDTVLACDVLYEKKSVPFIAELLPKLLIHSGFGKILMTDPTHRTPQNRQQFLDLLNNQIGNKGIKLEKSERQQRKTEQTQDDMELMFFSRR